MAFYLSAAEKEIIAALQQQFGITEIEATEHHLQSKRELAYIYARRGNAELAEHLFKQLDEWNSEIKLEVERMSAPKVSEKTIILPQ